MKQVRLICADISCGHCVMTIKRELKDLDGVIVQDVDLATKTVTLNVASEETLAAAMALLTEIGYPPVRQD